MADQRNRDGESMVRSESDEEIRGRDTDEDEFDEVTEDQDDEEDIDDGEDSTY